MGRLDDMVFVGNARTLGVTIVRDQIRTRDAAGPIVGARAALETSGEIEKRITATRVLATGLIGLAWKKRTDKRSLWLTIEGPTFQTVVEVPPKHEKKARQWVAQFNTRARS